MKNKWTGKIGNKAVKISLLVICVMVCLSSLAGAAQLSGIVFNENFQDQGINMKLQGMGLKTVFFFKAFVAGFYTNDMKQASLPAESSQRIEVEYFVNIPARKLSQFTVEQMKLNISPVEFGLIQKQIKLMAQYFVDLKPGDRFSLTYIPGTGTKFAHNGRLTGIIQGSLFARALFAVWIGQKPFDKQLKEQICGLSKEQQVHRKVDL